MDFSGTETINAAPEKVFDSLTDPHEIARCVPMMQDVQIRSDDEFDFKVSVSGFSVGFTYQWTERKRPNLVRSMIKGGSRMIGRASFESVMRIDGTANGPTQIDWMASTTVSGMIARSVDDEQLTTFVNNANANVIACIREQLEQES